MNFKKGRLGAWRRIKRKGFIAKGVTKRHWWDVWDVQDKDMTGNSRQLLKRETAHQTEEALRER